MVWGQAAPRAPLAQRHRKTHHFPPHSLPVNPSHIRKRGVVMTSPIHCSSRVLKERLSEGLFSDALLSLDLPAAQIGGMSPRPLAIQPGKPPWIRHLPRWLRPSRIKSNPCSASPKPPPPA